MKILLPFKGVPNPETRIKVLYDGRGISTEDVQFVINPFDEIAIEEALRIKERGEAGELVGVTIGDEACEEQIRAALAMGIDRALHVRDDRALDPYAIARILVAVVKRERPALVILGKQAIDDDSNQTGQMLAGLLGWPQATFVSKLEFIESKQRAECTRETDAGLEVVRVKLPAVITTDLRLNEPRYVSLPGLMRARRKPIETLSCAELGAAVEPRSLLLRMSPPPSRPAGVRVSSVNELVAKLRDEAKVI
jgi:electron transfer flavoprotein beta subunit